MDRRKVDLSLLPLRETSDLFIGDAQRQRTVADLDEIDRLLGTEEGALYNANGATAPPHPLPQGALAQKPDSH